MEPQQLPLSNSPSPNSQPVVTIAGGDQTISDSDNAAGERVSLSGNASDTDGQIVSYEWTVNTSVMGTEADIVLTLADGTSTIFLKVADNDGATNTTSVTVTIEEPSGFPEYNRSDYLTSWLDRDGDCIGTRDEVLMIESTIPVTLSNDGYDVLAGLWEDPYTAMSFTNPSDLDVDHLVPLSEAHDSGAAFWTRDEKRAFANDTTTAHALIAVDLSANRAKGAKDPALWLPPNQDYHCEYVRNWLNVKRKYNLNIDENERAAIESILMEVLQLD
jgi:hypothetical protein